MSNASVSLAELLDTLMFLGAGEGHEAYLCLDTGQIHLAGDDLTGEDWPVPDDLETSDRYLPVPDKRELRLGRNLVLAFIDAEAPDDYDRVRDYFSRRGAYARFKDLLVHRDLLNRRYAYVHVAETEALRSWCARNDLVETD
jgi:hypothetical protein